MWPRLNPGWMLMVRRGGGLALTAGNDITAFVRDCLADTEVYYEISFAPALDQKRGEYHHLEIHVADRKVTARTRQGYYTQPSLP